MAAHDFDLRDASSKELRDREVAQLVRPQPAVAGERAEHLRDRLRRIRDEWTLVVRPEDVGAYGKTIEAEPLRELADEVSISKQSVNDLLRDLEEAGYVTLEVDQSDRRARIIRLTRSGRRLDAAIWDAAEKAERSLEDSIGKARIKEFRRTLADVTAAIHGREE